MDPNEMMRTVKEYISEIPSEYKIAAAFTAGAAAGRYFNDVKSFVADISAKISGKFWDMLDLPDPSTQIYNQWEQHINEKKSEIQFMLHKKDKFENAIVSRHFEISKDYNDLADLLVMDRPKRYETYIQLFKEDKIFSDKTIKITGYANVETGEFAVECDNKSYPFAERDLADFIDSAPEIPNQISGKDLNYLRLSLDTLIKNSKEKPHDDGQEEVM